MVLPLQPPSPPPSDLTVDYCTSQTRPQTPSLAFVAAPPINRHSSNPGCATRTTTAVSLLNNRPVSNSFSPRFSIAAGCSKACAPRRCVLPITAMSATANGSGSGIIDSSSDCSSNSRSPRNDDKSADLVAKGDTSSSTGSSTSASSTAAAANPSVSSPPKRKRGRPKGSKNRKPSPSRSSSASRRSTAAANSINPLMNDDDDLADLQLDVAPLQQDFSKLRAPNGIRNSKTEPDDFLQELLPILAADEMRELEGESPEEIDARSILLDLINEISALDDRQAATDILEDLLGDDDDDDDDNNNNNSNESDDSNNTNAENGTGGITTDHGHATGAWNNLRPFKLLNEDDDFKHKQCDACKGSGMVKCSYCNGEGFVDFGENNQKFHADFPDGDMTLPAHVMGNTYHCPLCGGWTKERCVKCLGVGELNHLSWTEERVMQRPKGAARPVDPMWHALDMDKVLEEEGLDRVEYGQDGFIILRAKPRKKGAGRPRKTPATTAATAKKDMEVGGSLAEIVSTTTSGGGDSVGGSSGSGRGTTSKPAKRRRGRPRKNEVRDEKLSKAVAEAVNANQAQGEANVVTGGKRGRRRSSGSSSSSSSSSTDDGADTTTTSSASALPLKAMSAKPSSAAAAAAAAAVGRQQQQRRQDQQEEQQAVSQRRMNESAGTTVSNASASANTMRQLGQELQNTDDDNNSISSDSDSSSPSTDFVNITDYQVSRRLRNIERRDYDSNDDDAD